MEGKSYKPFLINELMPREMPINIGFREHCTCYSVCYIAFKMFDYIQIYIQNHQNKPPKPAIFRSGTGGRRFKSCRPD